MVEEVKGFIIYRSFFQGISLLSREQKGALLEALFADIGEGEMPSLDPVTTAIFTMMLPAIHNAQDAFSKRAAASRENGKKGGRPRKDTSFYEEESLEEPRQNLETCRFSEKPRNLNRIEENRINNINTPLYPPKGGEQVSLVPEVPTQKPSRAKRKPKGADLPPYTDEFEQLWKEYPRKDGKGNAYRAYLELSEAGVLPEHEDFKQRIISRRYEPDWEKDDGRYVPHMATWLHRNGWEDEGCQWRSQATNNRQDEFEAILDSYSWAPKRDEYQHPEKLHERERQLTEALKAAGF